MFFVPPPILISFDVLLLFKVGGKSREDVLLSDSVGPAVCTQAFLYLCTDCDGRAAPLQSRPVALITHFIFPSSSSLSAGRDSHSLRWFHRAACRRYAQNSVCVGGLFIFSTNWTTLRSCRGVLHSSGPQGWFLDVAEDKNKSFPHTEMNFSQNSIETNQCFFYWSSADAVCFIYIDVAELERPCQWSEVHFKGSHLFRSSSRPAGGDEMRRRQAGRSVDDALSHHEQGNTTNVSTKTQLKGGGNDRTGKRLISEERRSLNPDLHPRVLWIEPTQASVGLVRTVTRSLSSRQLWVFEPADRYKPLMDRFKDYDDKTLISVLWCGLILFLCNCFTHS